MRTHANAATSNNYFLRHIPAKTNRSLPYCDGWLTNFDAAQDLTFANLSGPGHWSVNTNLPIEPSVFSLVRLLETQE